MFKQFNLWGSSWIYHRVLFGCSHEVGGRGYIHYKAHDHECYIAFIHQFYDILNHGMCLVQSETNETFHTQLLYNITYLMISTLAEDLFPRNVMFTGILTEHGGDKQ